MNENIKPLSLAALLVASSGISHAAFDSGSDGSDGALIFPENLGDHVFDPDSNYFLSPLDSDRDGIYHFTSISIGSGTSVQLRGDVLGQKPVIWLSTGNVDIEGTIQMYVSDGDYSIPGAGGFSGGKSGGPVDGQGPGGTPGSNSPGYQADESHINPYLIPLIGGSGVGANTSSSSGVGQGGGGAMLLASSGRINIPGYIYGSSASYGGNLRLVANEISGDGSLYGFNVLRLEAFTQSYTGTVGSNTKVVTRPGALFPINPIKITLVDAAAVDQTKPGANKGEADVTINNGNAVTVKVECVGIALGTTIEVLGWNDTVGEVSAITNGLTGTLQASEATCSMVIPTGNTTFMARVIPIPPVVE